MALTCSVVADLGRLSIARNSITDTNGTIQSIWLGFASTSCTKGLGAPSFPAFAGMTLLPPIRIFCSLQSRRYRDDTYGVQAAETVANVTSPCRKLFALSDGDKLFLNHRKNLVGPVRVRDRRTRRGRLCGPGVRLLRTAPSVARDGIFRLGFCGGIRECAGGYPSPRGQPFQTGPWDD